MSYTDVFGGSTVQPSDVQYASVTLTASITTDWPEYATTTQPVARIMKVSASSGSLTITLPSALLVSVGQDVLFDNSGANTFSVLDNAGGVIATVAAGEVKYFYLSANSTAAGTWRVTIFGVGSSAADAGQLAGYGLKAITSTLNTAPPVTAITANTTVALTDRAKVFVWAGTSGTLTLPTTSGSTSDFVFEVRNQGTGTLTVQPSGGVLIDSSASIALSISESCFVHMGAIDWYTVGRGRNTSFNFTQLTKVVDGGTDVLTLAEASNVVQNYTGALLSNQIITLPAVVQVYYVRNNATGAYTLTFGCAGGGASVVCPALQTLILFCDGVNIVNANTTLAGGITALLFTAGSVSTPSVAIDTANNGLYSPASGQVAVSANGAQAALFTATGVTVPGTLTASNLSGTNTGDAAANSWVTTNFAPLASPTFTGTVTIPAGASISGYATLASPTFTGTVTIPAGASISGYATLADPVFTGNPTAPTPVVTDNDTSLATTAFTQTLVSASISPGAGAAMWVSGTTYAYGVVVFSPADLQSYRRAVAGAGVLDPKFDPVNWTPLNATVLAGATIYTALNFSAL